MSEKRHEKGQQAVLDQNKTMEKSWMMMMDWTDKEHEKLEEACSIRGAAYRKERFVILRLKSTDGCSLEDWPMRMIESICICFIF